MWGWERGQTVMQVWTWRMWGGNKGGRVLDCWEVSTKPLRSTLPKVSHQTTPCFPGRAHRNFPAVPSHWPGAACRERGLVFPSQQLGPLAITLPVVGILLGAFSWLPHQTWSAQWGKGLLLWKEEMCISLPPYNCEYLNMCMYVSVWIIGPWRIIWKNTNYLVNMEWQITLICWPKPIPGSLSSATSQAGMTRWHSSDLRDVSRSLPSSCYSLGCGLHI